MKFEEKGGNKVNPLNKNMFTLPLKNKDFWIYTIFSYVKQTCY